MNVQTERIDNHKAQFTVEIEAQQFDDAKRKAAKKISRQVRIKGFRKGKAPYRIIAQYVGEAAILEEAVELLGNDVYKHALDESEIEPYGPGSLDDFKVDPAPTFIFSVPLQPEVDLKDYADVRLDFEEPEISDEEVENMLKQMQLQEAETLDEDVEVVAAGNRVTLDVHSEFIDGEEDDEDDDDDAEASDADEEDDDSTDEDDETPVVPKKGDQFFHRHDVTVILNEDDEPIVPGFVAGLVGTALEDEAEFDITLPEDDDDYKDVAGRNVRFHVTVKKIEAVSVPELDDALAQKISEASGDDPLDLAGLRQRTRDDLEKQALQQAKSDYGDKVLAQIVEGAEVHYPELMVEERIDDMLGDLDRNLQQQGMNLETYMRITGSTKETLQDQYRDSAIDSVKRTLVLRELVQAQNVEMGDEQIEARLDTMMMQFGAQGDQFRSLIDTPQMRENILNELLMDNIMTRLVAIGRGVDPEQAVKDREAEVQAENEEAQKRIERMMAAQADDEAEEEDAETDAVAEASADDVTDTTEEADEEATDATDDSAEDDVEAEESDDEEENQEDE